MSIGCEIVRYTYDMKITVNTLVYFFSRTLLLGIKAFETIDQLVQCVLEREPIQLFCENGTVEKSGRSHM